MNKELLTEAEHKVINLLGEVATIFAQEVVSKKSELAGIQDVREFFFHIHNLQSRVMGQAAARAYPDLYRLAGDPGLKPKNNSVIPPVGGID